MTVMISAKHSWKIYASIISILFPCFLLLICLLFLLKAKICVVGSVSVMPASTVSDQIAAAINDIQARWRVV